MVPQARANAQVKTLHKRVLNSTLLGGCFFQCVLLSPSVSLSGHFSKMGCNPLPGRAMHGLAKSSKVGCGWFRTEDPHFLFWGWIEGPKGFQMTYDVPAAKLFLIFVFLKKLQIFQNSLTNYNWDFGSSKGGAQEIFVKIEKQWNNEKNKHFFRDWVSDSRNRLEI